MTREELAARIRELRLRAGISQAAAARHAGVSRSTWQKYERAEYQPSAIRLHHVARALDCPIAALYHDDAIADVRVSAATLARLRQDGAAALPDVLAALSARLAPALMAAAQVATPAAPRVSTGARSTPSAVAGRMVRRHAAALARAETQLANAEAQTLS